MSAYKYFVGIILLQLFYGFGITVLSHSLDALNPNFAIYITDYTSISPDLENITNQIEGSLNSQMNIPVVDLGALVFYSGNIIVDLMMNFFFAVPSLFSLIINGILNLFPIDAFVATYVKLFATSVITIMYFLSLLVFLTNIRSRGTIV